MTQPRPEPAPEDDEPAGEEEPAVVEPPQVQDGSRRRALGMLVAAGSVLYAGSLAVPAARFLASGAAEAGGGRWIRVIRLDSLPEGAPTRVQVRGDKRDAFTVTADLTLGSVWLRRSGAEVTALSSECPHLGCAIDLGGDGKSFGCPCHTSRFSLEGGAESGPSPRGMDPLATRIVDGWVEIELKRFRQGLAERVEVGA